MRRRDHHYKPERGKASWAKEQSQPGTPANPTTPSQAAPSQRSYRRRSSRPPKSAVIPIREWPRAILSKLSRHALKLFILLLLGLVAALIVILKPWEQPAPTSSMTPSQEEPVPEIAIADLANVKKVAESFINTSDVEERLALCRHPEETRALLDSFAPQAVSEIPVSLEHVALATSAVRSNYSIFFVDFEDETRRVLFVINTPDGLRVDWQAYARHSEAEWEKILSGQVAEPVLVRVVGTPSTYYNYDYADDTQWAAYEVGVSELGQRLFFYTERDSETHEQIEKALALTQRITLRILPDEEISKNRQSLITELVCSDWILP